MYLLFYLYVLCLFFFKQKTAYELRISDWSSDVCSSDLLISIGDDISVRVLSVNGSTVRFGVEAPRHIGVHRSEIYEKIQKKRAQASRKEIGRASCRERVCKYV